MKLSDTFWLTVVGQIQVLTILFDVILFFSIPKHGRQKYLELGLILMVALFADVASWTGILILHKNTNLLGSVYRIVEYALVILLYQKQIARPKTSVISFLLIGVVLAFGLINLFFIQGVDAINSYTSSLISFCLIIISMTYFFGSDTPLPDDEPKRNPMYWINVAFLFYNTTTLFIHLWVDYLVTVMDSRLIGIWMVHNILGIVFYTIVAYALVLIRNQFKADNDKRPLPLG